LRHKSRPPRRGEGSILSKQSLPKKMPNAKVLIEGKWLAFVAGVDDVTNVFASKDNAELVVLTKEGIVTYSGFPFIVERDYKKKEDTIDA